MSRKIYFNCLNSVEDYQNIFKEYLFIEDEENDTKYKIWNKSIETFLNEDIFKLSIEIGLSYGISFFKNIIV